MKFLDKCHAVLLYLGTFFTSPSFIEDSSAQHPLTFEVNQKELGYGPPKFRAPAGPEKGKFVCTYPKLGKQWTSCSTPNNRGCWLKGPNGDGFNITTDYENRYPEGIVREVPIRLRI
jgi:hypothetical protein